MAASDFLSSRICPTSAFSKGSNASADSSLRTTNSVSTAGTTTPTANQQSIPHPQRTSSTEDADFKNPFATPTTSAVSDSSHVQYPQQPALPIQQPKPCLQHPALPRHHRKVSSPRQSREASTSSPFHDQPTSHRHDRIHSDTTYAEPNNGKSGSWSSGGSTLEGLGSIDLEKGSLAKEYEQWRSSRASKTSRTSRQGRRSRDTRSGGGSDPEKQSHRRSSRRPSSAYPGHHVSSPDNASDAISEGDENDEAETESHHAATALQSTKAVNILLFLAGPVVFLSFVNFTWTLVSLLITLLSQPVRLCAKRLGFGTQLASLLGPALNLQLSAIYTPLPPHANEDGSYKIGWLILVQLLSPFVSMGVAFTSWVIAVYWLLAAIVGEPDPSVTEKRDDGRETCLALRGWWERWLERALVES